MQAENENPAAADAANQQSTSLANNEKKTTKSCKK